MRPDDKNGCRPTAERPFRVLLIVGSNRRQYDCPGVDSKSRALVLGHFDEWTDEFAHVVERKGKVEPGRFRSFGHTAPSHRWAAAELKWRELRMGLGRPPASSSPEARQRLGLNRDAMLSPGRSEGERLRGR